MTLRRKPNIVTGVCEWVRNCDRCIAIDGRQLPPSPFMADLYGLVDKMFTHIYVRKLDNIVRALVEIVSGKGSSLR